MTGTIAIVPPAAEPNPGRGRRDVQRARDSAASATAEVQRITDLLVELQDAADSAGTASQIAAEKAHRAQDSAAAAKREGARLATAAAAARKQAATSRMRAGLLAAHLSRAGGGDVSLNLALNGDRADDLLHQLATMSQLSRQSQVIYREALEDGNASVALEDQANAAASALDARSKAADTALAEAQAAASAARDVVAEQQRHQDQLISQLAQLQRTSTRLAAQYVAGEQHRRAEEAAAAKQAAADRAAAERVPPAPSAPQPNSAAAASAVAYARDRIGEPYRFAGAGPSLWDCSGLTMTAYRSVGLEIGGHGATVQYTHARTLGLLVPYSDVRVGDLIFYTAGGGDMYHVTIYSGSGMMIEAPYDGVPVREVPVRSNQRSADVARPTG